MRVPVPDGDHEFLSGFRFRSERVWDDDPAVSDTAVGQAMMLGDIHNSRKVLDAALRTARDEGCDVLVQVGDFWLQDSNWRGFSPEHAEVMHAALHAAIPVVVVDGNHEVWPCLSAFGARDDTAAARQAGRPLHLGGSLWWADRGSTWTWAGRRFGALGGSASPDRWMPRAAPYRWEQETTTTEDLERLLGNASGGLDVLISHDAPEGTEGLIGGLSYQMPPYLQFEADTVQALVRVAVDETEPALVFHGHWHQQNRCRLNARSEVIGLAADGHPSSGAVLSVGELETRHIDPLQRPRRRTSPHRT